MLKNVKYAKCVKCGKEYEATPNTTTCSCGGILDIVYDYDHIKAHFTRDNLEHRQEWSMWRYRPFLPVEADSAPTRCGWAGPPTGKRIEPGTGPQDALHQGRRAGRIPRPP